MAEAATAPDRNTLLHQPNDKAALEACLLASSDPKVRLRWFQRLAVLVDCDLFRVEGYTLRQVMDATRVWSAQDSAAVFGAIDFADPKRTVMGEFLLAAMVATGRTDLNAAAKRPAEFSVRRRSVEIGLALLSHRTGARSLGDAYTAGLLKSFIAVFCAWPDSRPSPTRSRRMSRGSRSACGTSTIPIADACSLGVGPSLSAT
jgi:hypothetical protein